MEKIYYILDSEKNDTLVDNLTYEQGIEWLNEFGLPTIHLLVEKNSQEEL